jgi:bifunctional NMN adenylyltransferase/nudix hydrolase
VVWATQNQFDKVHPTVDIAIFDSTGKDGEHLILGKKKKDNGFRFIGGFADPKDHSFEESAKREALEETGLVIDNLKYLVSLSVDDSRYRSETDKIITTFFAGYVISGTPKASDDIDELHRLQFCDLKEDDFIVSHQPLFRILKQKLFLQL